MSEYRFSDPADRTLPRLLRYQATRRPDHPFVRFATEPAISFGTMEHITDRLATGLGGVGVERGERVAIILPNCVEFVPVWFAISKLGAVEVPVNHDLKGSLLSYILTNSAPRVVVCHARFLSSLAEVMPDLPAMTALVVVGGTVVDAKEAGINLQRMVTYEELLQEADTPHPDVVDHRDTIAILYTSGTTGPSKGVMLSHHQYYVWAESIAANMALSSDDVYYHCLPLYYGDAQFMATYFALVYGARAVIYERFSASRYWDQLRESGATTTNLLGAMAHILWKQPPRDDDADNRLRICNAIPMPPFQSEFEERFDVRLVTGYGQTETNLVVYDTKESSRPGACGLPGPEYEVMIADDCDHPVSPGTVGEILIRPRNAWTIFSGYFAMPDKTAEAWRNLWFHTGDAGYMDEDGWLYFVERIKDAIRRRGQNISAHELESIVNEHPSVLECAAVAVPSELGEDEVKIRVVVRDGFDLSPVELLDFCRDQMPRFMVPRYVEITTELLPRTPSEKIAKEELRRAGNTDLTWDREAHGYEIPRV